MAESALEGPTTIDLLVRGVGLDPAAHAFAIPDSFGGWFDVTAQEFLDRVRSLARGFVAAELHPGDVLAVLSTTRFEATLVDYAAAWIGVAIVPLPSAASQSELLSLLDEARVQAVVVETARDFARIDELHGDLPLISDVWQIGLGDLDKLAELGRTVADAQLDERARQVTGETPAAVHAWHGPEGASQLVTVTHRELATRATALAEVLEGETGAGAAILQILPATDVHARVTALVAVATGTRLGHLKDPAALIETTASFRPTLLVARPGTVEQIDAAAHARSEATGRSAALRQALDVAVEHSIATSGGSVSRGLRTRFALADALVYRGLRKAVGGRLHTIVTISTDTSLTDRLRHIMRSLDVRPLEGYGDARTSGLATLERPGDPFDRPVGSVGAPLAGVEVAVEPDGSVAVRGIGVAADEGGWLRTGEFGALEDGRLVLADRDGDVSGLGETQPRASDDEAAADDGEFVEGDTVDTGSSAASEL